MSYDADISRVMDRFNSWARSAVIGDDAFREIDSLMQHHRDDRGRVFEDLVNALKRDTDIQSPWDSLCDKGGDLTDRLRSAIEPKLPFGLRDTGLQEFFDGEKYGWQACKSGRIGLIAEAMHDIEINNVEIFKKLEEDLKNARENEKVVDEQTRATFGQMRDAIRSAGVETAATVAAIPAAAIPMIGKSLAPKIKALVQSLLGGSTAMRELARKKRAAKGILLDNSALVDKAKSQIDDRAIEDIRRRAEELARSWKDATRNDYHADWESFGNTCCDGLKEKANKATEKAKALFGDMAPLLKDALTKSFVSILSDPSSLDAFQGQLSDDIQKIFDDLTQENAVIASLHDSDPKRSAAAQMTEIMSDVTELLTQLKTAIRENEELMKT